MDDYISALNMLEIVVDEITFERKGLKNDNKLKLALKVQIGSNDEGIYKITLILKGKKQKEYKFLIKLSGFFVYEEDEVIDEKTKQDLIYKNTVAIMMPYLRNQAILLTSQPGMDSVILPIFDVHKMVDRI